MELPVLDCSLLEQGPEAEARFAAALGTALEQVGFFFLVNHGVDAALVDSVFAQTAAFHALPVEEKLLVQMNEHKVGYMPFGGSIRKGYAKPSGRAALNFRFNSIEPLENRWPEDADASGLRTGGHGIRGGGRRPGAQAAVADGNEPWAAGA